MASKKQTYENALARIEEIVGKMDSGEVPFRETMELLQEAAKLLDFCGKELEVVSGEIENLRLDQLALRLGAKDS